MNHKQSFLRFLAQSSTAPRILPSPSFAASHRRLPHIAQPARLRTLHPPHRSFIFGSIRLESTSPSSRPLTDRVENDATANQASRQAVPSYIMSFTCRKCHERSSHKVSKQGYHHGTVLITCTGCKNKHLISDHLKIFSDTGITIEEILTKKGETIQKGTLEFSPNDEVITTPPPSLRESLGDQIYKKWSHLDEIAKRDAAAASQAASTSSRKTSHVPWNKKS